MKRCTCPLPVLPGHAGGKHGNDGTAIGVQLAGEQSISSFARYATMCCIGDGGWSEQMTGNVNATVSALRHWTSSRRDIETWRSINMASIRSFYFLRLAVWRSPLVRFPFFGKSTWHI